MKSRYLSYIVSILSLCSSVSISNAQWEKYDGLNNFINGISITTICSNGQYIFVGSDSGIFRSADEGQSWKHADSGLTWKTITSLAVSGNHIYAATTGDNDKGGIFLSDNNGTSWIDLHIDSQPIAMSALSVSGDTLIASTVSTSGSVYLSIDSGFHWRRIFAKPTDEMFFRFHGNDIWAYSLLRGFYRISSDAKLWTSVVVIPGESTTEYDLTAIGSNLFVATDHGIFKSINNGSSWNKMNAGLTDTVIFSLAVSGDSLLAGTQFGSVFLSTDEGSSWSVISTDLPYYSVNHILIKGEKIFFGTNGGMFSFSTNTKIWTSLNQDLPLGYVILTSIRSLLFARTQNGSFRSSDCGVTWQGIHLIQGSILQQLFSFDTLGDILFAVSTFINSENGVYRSDDNGLNWTFVKSMGYPLWVGSNEKTLFLGYVTYNYPNYTPVFHYAFSSDTGKTWKGLGGLPDYPPGFSLSIGNRVILNLEEGGGAYYSDDNGSTWHTLFLSSVNSLSFIGTTLFAGTDSGIYLSADSGGTWNQTFIHGQPASLLDDGSNIYVFVSDLQNGFYFSTDKGLNWKRIENALPERGGRFTFCDSYLFDIQSPLGIWRRLLAELQVKDVNRDSKDNSLMSQNYPNPFVLNTTIQYIVPELDFVSMKVYNSQGSEIATLVNKELPPGQYNTTWAPDDLPNGSYFCRIMIGSQTYVTKMLLQR